MKSLPHGLITFMIACIALLSACQTTPSHLTNGSGFGGTGAPVTAFNQDMSGFGGTGQTSSGFGGTGIIGTISDFGSIWVNGIEIGYGEKTQIVSNLKDQDHLKLGQQVVLETLPLADKTLTTQIHIYYPLAGQIMNLETDQIMINQHPVRLTPETLSDEGLNLAIGEFIAINGYQNADQSWTATRLNQNTGFKSFYHPEPELKFSPTIKRLIVEQKLTAFNQWRSLKSIQAVLPLELYHHKPLKGSKDSSTSLEMPPLNLPKQTPIKDFQSQKQLLEMQRGQQALMRQQMDQQRQQQVIREQQQLLQNGVPMRKSGS